MWVVVVLVVIEDGECFVAVEGEGGFDLVEVAVVWLEVAHFCQVWRWHSSSFSPNGVKSGSHSDGGRFGSVCACAGMVSDRGTEMADVRNLKRCPMHRRNKDRPAGCAADGLVVWEVISFG